MQIIVTKEYNMRNGTKIKKGVATVTNELAQNIVNAGCGHFISAKDMQILTYTEIRKELNLTPYQFSKIKDQLTKFGMKYIDNQYTIKRYELNYFIKQFKSENNGNSRNN